MQQSARTRGLASASFFNLERTGGLMSMFGSLEKDYEAWKESASDRGLNSAIADDYEHVIREAFLAGAACVIGGASEVEQTGGDVGHFLDSYRDQVNVGRKPLGI